MSSFLYCVTVDARRVTVDAGRVTIDAGRVTVDAGRVTVDARHVTVDAGCVTVDAGCVTRDDGNSKVKHFPLGYNAVSGDMQISNRWGALCFTSPMI